MTQWYYASKDNERQGPVEADTLRDKLARGALNQDTLVWCDGMAQWQPVSEVHAQLSAAVGPGSAEASPAASAASVSEPAASPYAAPSSTLSVGDGTVASTGGEIVYAGFWKRVAANIIDIILLYAVGAILGPIFGLSMLVMLGLPEGRLDDPSAAMDMALFQLALPQLVLTVLAMAYFACFHSSKQMASVGKMAVGIKVVRPDGTPITLARGIGRYFAFVLSSLPMGIGLLMAAFTGRKQALHDMLCDTLVVDKWAFTDRPDLQQRGLGPVTIIVLVLFGLLMAFLILLVIIMVGISIAQLGGNGRWP